MKSKPVSPALHGIIDYVFATALYAVPRIMGINKKATRLSTINSIATALYSAATNYRFGLMPVITLNRHRLADLANLSMLALSTISKSVYKDKRALVFTTTMVAAGLLTILFKDWDAKE